MSTLAYPDNIGVLRVTKVGSRYVTLATGIILLVRGGLQPFGRLLQAVPLPVLAAGTVLLIVMKAALSLRATDKAKAELRNLPSG
jgi:xanthine/uracil permease